ncbi:MAG: ABC transporter permease [Acidobacteriia bacterium]|nr:ABC transporter permease [Terriglobia bacterium]
MDLMSTLRIALRALARNKMRSILTMLGVIIGVAAVIAVVGIGQGGAQKAQEQLAAMGSNLIFVGSGTVTRGGLHMGHGNTKTLIYSDLTAILKECPAVKNAAPGVGTGAQVVFGNDNWGTQISGTSPEFFEVRNWAVAQGTEFTQQDVEMAANVAVVGETVRKNLFGSTNALGQTIRIKDMPFKVVGVLESKGMSAAMGNDQDDVVIIPYTTHQKKLTGDTWLRYIMVSAVSKEGSYTAEQQITSLLRDRHRIRPEQDDDFFVRNLADLAELRDQQNRVMTLLLLSIASVSLLVGGIGIMNIMLVSVTERTREIGIRMAIGATETDVQKQFLLESVTLSLLGGTVGILTGVGATQVIVTVFGWPVLVSPVAIGVAVFFSMAVGIFFGFYPARKAARLDPIEALRYE